MVATRRMRRLNREVEDISTHSPQIVDLLLLAMKTSPTLPPFDHLLTYLPASCPIRDGDIVRIGIRVLNPYGVFCTVVSVSDRIILFDGGSCVAHDEVYHVFAFDDNGYLCHKSGYAATTLDLMIRIPSYLKDGHRYLTVSHVDANNYGRRKIDTGVFQTRNELARVNSEDVIGEVGDTKFDNYVKIITLLLFNGALPQMHYLSSNYRKKLAAFMS